MEKFSFADQSDVTSFKSKLRFLVGMSFFLLCFLSSEVRADEVDNTYKEEEGYLGGNKETQEKCNTVIEQNKDKPRKELSPEVADLLIKCQAYVAAERGLTVDSVMLGMDVLTFATCAGACGSANPVAITACDTISILQGLGDLAGIVAIKESLNSDWHGMDYFTVTLGALGTGVGAGGLGAKALGKGASSAKGVKAVGGAAK